MANLQELLKNKKKAIAAASGRRENTTKLQSGKNRIRVLPSWRGDGDVQFYHDFGNHFIKDDVDSKKPTAVYMCVDKTFGKPCPVCDAIEAGINSSASDDTKAALKASKASGRILVNALMLDKDKNTPVILELSPTTFDKVIDIITDNPDEENDAFNIATDVKNGVDIVITRSGTGINTEYSVIPALKGSKPVPKAALDNLFNLDEYVAQEYESGMNKAIAAVSTVSGALPSPKKSSASSDTPFDEDVPEFESAPKAVDKAAADDDALDGEFEEIDEAPKKEESDISDDELDSLLDELD